MNKKIFSTMDNTQYTEEDLLELIFSVTRQFFYKRWCQTPIENVFQLQVFVDRNSHKPEKNQYNLLAKALYDKFKSIGLEKDIGKVFQFVFGYEEIWKKFAFHISWYGERANKD